MSKDKKIPWTEGREPMTMPKPPKPTTAPVPPETTPPPEKPGPAKK